MINHDKGHRLGFIALPLTEKATLPPPFICLKTGVDLNLRLGRI